MDGLRVWAREPVPRVRVSVVTDTPRAVYSGMVPGLVAGQYRLEDCEFDVERLARRAGAACFLNLLGNRFFSLLLSVLVGQHIKDTPNIRRFADGWLLLRMSALAAGRLFFTA